MSAITAKARRKMKKYAVLTREPRCFLGSLDFSWEQRKLSDIATMHARIGWQNLRTSEFLDSGDYMLITGTDFNDGAVNYSTCHFVEKESVSRFTPCAAVVKDKKKPSEINDFRGLLARVVRLEHPTLMQYPYSPASKGTYYLLLSTRQKLPADRHFVLFSDDEFRTLSF